MKDDGRLKGRGTAKNPANRFTEIEIVPDPAERQGFATTFTADTSKSIISSNTSPDLEFDRSLNPYRGCEHGCSYCYARPTHEFLGLSAGIDFEARILVKENAGLLLRKELSAASWTPRLLALSGVTDAYQPVEKRLRITRSCLEVLAEFRNPVMVVTKNQLVTRDIDLLSALAADRAASVFLSISTLDGKLSASMEPRASHPRNRLAAIAALAAAGIPTGVLVAPIIPGLTDHEIPEILGQAKTAGAAHARYTILRLPGAVREIFVDWLQHSAPDRVDKVLNRVRSIRGGRLNVSTFGKRFHGQGVFGSQIRELFSLGCRRSGLSTAPIEHQTNRFRGRQLTLFGSSS